ncbi:MAG: SRPBCC family protein [Lysobacteraceae bacterium]
MPLILQLQATIAAPPGAVWASLTDIPNWPSWLPNIVRLELLDDNAFGVGMRFRETRKMFGRDATEVFEVIAARPTESLELRVDGSEGSSRRGSYYFNYRLEPVAVGTCLHLDARIEGMGWFFRRIGKLFAGGFRRALAADLAAFKRHVEAQPTR